MEQRGRLNGLTGLIDIPNPGGSTVTGFTSPSVFQISKCLINVAEYGARRVDTHGRSITINNLQSNNSETSENGDEFARGDFSGQAATFVGQSSVTPFISASGVMTITEQQGVSYQTFAANLTNLKFTMKEGQDAMVSGDWERTGSMVAPGSTPASGVSNFTFSGMSKTEDQYSLHNTATQAVVYHGIGNTDAAENALLAADYNAATTPVPTLKFRENKIIGRPSSQHAKVLREWGSNDHQDDIWNQGSKTGNQDDTNYWTQVRQVPCDANETETDIYNRLWFGYGVTLTVGLGGAITGVSIVSGGKGIVNGTYGWNVTDNNGALCGLSTTVTTGTITSVAFGATTGAFTFPPNGNRAVLSYDPTYYASFPPAFKYQNGAIGIHVKKIQPLIAVVSYRYMYNFTPIKASGRLVERNVFARRVITNSSTGASKVQVYCRRCIQYATGQWLAWLGRQYQQETVIRYRLTINAVDTNFIVNYSSNEGRMYSLQWGKLNNGAAFGQGTGTVRFVSGQPSGCDYYDEASGGFTKSSEMTYDFLYDPFRFFTLSGWAPFLPVSSNLGTGWVDASNFADLTATVADSSPGLCDFGQLFLIGNGNA